MKHSLLAIVLTVLCSAPAFSASVTLTPLVVAQDATLPTLTTACASPNEPARVSGYAFYEMPTIAELQGVSGTAQVQIHLASNGTLTSQKLFSSSGNPWLDSAAIESAKMTKFVPETRSCEHVDGSYIYAVEY